MHLVSFRVISDTEDDALRTGVLIGDEVLDLPASDDSFPREMRRLLRAPDAVLSEVRRRARDKDGVCRALSTVKLAPPIPDPQKIICIGLNYRDHAIETGASIPSEPVVFSKFPTTLVGAGDAICLPALSKEVDYEAELVAVIGRRGKNIPEEEALDYIDGYTIGHDVSARDWQKLKEGKQWLLGKSFDTFAPTGPALVTADEIPDPQQLSIKFRLNGETLQDSSTAQMIFPVRKLIAYVSQVFTLEPGDLLFTGTPSGVGTARTPPVYLKPGDVCEVEIEKLGILSNPCVAG